MLLVFDDSSLGFADFVALLLLAADEVEVAFLALGFDSDSFFFAAVEDDFDFVADFDFGAATGLIASSSVLASLPD